MISLLLHSQSPIYCILNAIYDRRSSRMPRSSSRRKPQILHHEGRYTMADMNTFFHEATLRICGSLEIETVAKDCLEYLKDFMPLDGILIIHYDRLSMSLMVLAAASNVPLNLNKNAHTVIKFSPEAHQELNRAKKNIRIYNNAEGILSKNMWENLGFKIGRASCRERVCSTV